MNCKDDIRKQIMPWLQQQGADKKLKIAKMNQLKIGDTGDWRMVMAMFDRERVSMRN